MYSIVSSVISFSQPVGCFDEKSRTVRKIRCRLTSEDNLSPSLKIRPKIQTEGLNKFKWNYYTFIFKGSLILKNKNIQICNNTVKHMKISLERMMWPAFFKCKDT